MRTNLPCSRPARSGRCWYGAATERRGYTVCCHTLALICCLAVLGCRPRPAEEIRTTRVVRGDVTVHTILEGTLDARRVEKVISNLAGGGALSELAQEGALVKKGDVIARFDDSQPRRDLARLERDAELARLDVQTLERSTLPLEIGKARAAIADIEADHDAEKRYVTECEDLVREGLMNAMEMQQARAKAERMAAKLDLLRRECSALETVVASSRLARASATSLAAERELAIAREQVDSCVVRAPADGAVVYMPLHLGGEFRVARVGDTILKNQPFLSIPDPSEWISVCSVPEMEVDRVATGAEVIVQPLAMPALQLKGRVESVGAMAQELPGRSGWAKYFRVVIKVEVPPETLGRIKSGLSVQAKVLSASRAGVLTLPRAALDWNDAGMPSVTVRADGAIHRRPVQPGLLSDQTVEIREGVREGDEVLLP